MAGVSTLLAVGGSIAGTLVQRQGTLAQAKAQEMQHRFQEAQYKRQATEARAVASQKAAQRDRDMRLAISDQLAAAAATGGASDPSVLRLFGDMEAQGQKNVQTELATGENQAQTYDYAARAQDFSARNAKQAGKIAAGTDLLSGATSLFSRFGRRQPMTTSYMYG